MGLAFAGVGMAPLRYCPGAAHARADRLANRLHGEGILILSCCADHLLPRKRPEDIGLEPDGDAAPPRLRPSRSSNIVDRAWPHRLTLKRAIATARFWWISLGISADCTSGTRCRFTRPNICSTSASVLLSRSGRWVWSAARHPGQILLGTSPTGWGVKGYGPQLPGLAICFAALIGLKYAPVLPWLPD